MTDTESRQTQAWLMLTVRAQQWDWSPADHEGLSQSEVAAMLAGLERRAYLAGRLCLAEDWTCRRSVRKFLHEHAYDLATVECWDLRKGPGQLQDLVDLGLLEMTSTTLACPECDGTGMRTFVSHIEPRSCELCEGSGRVPLLQRSRADLIGVAERDWRRVWRDRYRGVYSELSNWVSDARRHLARELGKRRRLSA